MDRLKFTYFSEIRNQFAHNKSAADFSSCFSFIDMKNKLVKIYRPKDVLNTEEFYESLFFDLFTDLMKIHQRVVDFISQKYFNKGMEIGKQKLFNILVETLQEYTKEDLTIYNIIADIFKITAYKANAEIIEEYKRL